MAGHSACAECRVISINPDNAVNKGALTRDLSPAAQACAAWFRRLARALKVCRLYKSDNGVVVQARGQVLDLLAKLIAENGGWALRFTPTEIHLGDEPVVRQKTRGPREEASAASGEELLPFVFYRDGIRGIHFPLGVPREELEALFDALKVVGGGRVTHDDLVTMLWQANLAIIQIDSVPLEQTIYLSSRPGASTGDATAGGEMYAWSPAGAEVHADIGLVAGAQGLHKDTFDDWDLADSCVEVPEAYESLLPATEYSRAHFRAAWDDESNRSWTHEAPEVLREMLALDPGEETRQALSHAVVSWIAGALQRSALEETQHAIELLREFDPDMSRSERELAGVIARLDHAHLAEYLDEAETDEQARFAALAVGLGRLAVDLAVAVMVRAARSRTRAAACSALCYLCADQPGLLDPYVTDSDGDVVLQVVFVLGQIGGAEVADLLRLAAQHPDPRVRRQVIQSLGSVPAPSRIPSLLEALRTDEPQLLVAALSMLARERNPRVARALLERVAAPDFESQSEEMQRAWFSTLAEVAEDESVPALEALLNRGGWLAKRSFLRNAAARTLRRIGTIRAHAVLEAGLKSRAAAVRGASHYALSSKSHP
jgi:hypothetical protein